IPLQSPGLWSLQPLKSPTRFYEDPYLFSSKALRRAAWRRLPARRSQSTKDLALLEMEVVLIEIPQRPGIVDIKKHAVRNCGLLFYFWLLADQPVFAFPIGRQPRRRLLSHGLLSGFLHV